MSYKFLKSVKFIKSMFPAGTFFRKSYKAVFNGTDEIYLLFDKSHDFGFKDQIERATALIMNNITEGYERKSNVELRYRNNT